MALEAFGYIKDLVPTNPTGTDPKSEGDDHVRGVKETLQDQFSSFTDGIPLEMTETELNAYDGRITTLEDAPPNPSLGEDQTWTNVTGSRNPGQNYTNSTGRTITVSAYSSLQDAIAFTMYVDGLLLINSIYNGTNGGTGSGTVIVPNGSIYRININAGSITGWHELR